MRCIDYDLSRHQNPEPGEYPTALGLHSGMRLRGSDGSGKQLTSSETIGFPRQMLESGGNKRGKDAITLWLVFSQL